MKKTATVVGAVLVAAVLFLPFVCGGSSASCAEGVVVCPEDSTIRCWSLVGWPTDYLRGVLAMVFAVVVGVVLNAWTRSRPD